MAAASSATPDEVARECWPTLPVALGDVVYPVTGASALDLSGMIDSTFYAQTSLYAVEVALDALHRSRGAEPAAAPGTASANSPRPRPARRPPATATRRRPNRVSRGPSPSPRARGSSPRSRRMAGAPPVAGCMMAVGVGADACEAAIAAADLRDFEVCEVGAVNGAGSTVLGDARAAAASLSRSASPGPGRGARRVEYVKTARFLAEHRGVATFVEIGDGMLGRDAADGRAPGPRRPRDVARVLAPAKEANGDGDADVRAFDAAIATCGTGRWQDRARSATAWPLARLYFAMVVLDALKKMVWGSFEVVGICLGGCGLKGSMNFVNLTRTKWFIISLAWCRLVGFFAERKLAPRAAERWLPLAVAALHVFLRFVDVYENGDAYYSTKVGQLKPLNYFVKSAYYYVVWPLLMPMNLGTLRCSARSEKREDVLFARPPCVPARRHRVQPAGAADPPPADRLPRRLPARARRGASAASAASRVAYLLFDETVAAAILGSYVYWCPATPTFFSELGAAPFGYMWHLFFVPATAMVAGSR
ncbi:hypothetical protein JL720_3107 [Aureococcus anophagefferens]|nr:hypothetical protein JL720_3107 [Aureococcus anophagefferens]